MDTAKQVILIIVFCICLLCAVFGGLYVTMWLCIVGGIADAINGITSDPVNAVKVGIGVLKFMVAIPAGWVTFFVSLVIGRLVLELA